MELVDAYGQAKDVVADLSSHLGNFFKSHQQLEKHVHEEELKAKKTRDPELSVNQEAFNRVLAQKEMNRLETELREMMVYQAPKELGAIWSEFEVMRDRVKAERAEIQRQETVKQQVAAWRRASIKRKIKDQLTSIVAVVHNVVVSMANDNAKDESDVPWSLLIAVVVLCFVLILALPIMGIMYMDMNNATAAAMEEVKKMRELRAKILMGIQE